MKNQTHALEYASVLQYCKAVRLPTVGANFVPLAEQAVKEQHSHIRYLEALLAMESEERDRHAIANRIRDAQLSRVKTLRKQNQNLSEKENQKTDGSCPIGASRWSSARRRLTDEAKYSYRVGQIRVSKWATPEYRTHMLQVPVGVPMSEVQEAYVRLTLRHTHNNKTRAAELLGLCLRTLHNEIRSYENGAARTSSVGEGSFD